MKGKRRVSKIALHIDNELKTLLEKFANRDNLKNSDTRDNSETVRQVERLMSEIFKGVFFEFLYRCGLFGV